MAKEGASQTYDTPSLINKVKSKCCGIKDYEQSKYKR